MAQNYLLWSTMYSMADFSSASVQFMQVPFGGMTLKPFVAWASRVSMPWAIRGAQAAASPNLGAPAAPVP